ncbi:hypothetical protein T440DRAFT_503156 [Plenodomus tracheiphilus IPT5]|uniref:Uncharacterized protein n=1 Tax=Plenodomus tracheiphilus IPT5 TaxID=1408161 RepID=A0A6A7ALJ0_9PLEO|nr:hypothetical protein T440DRAFT_503156 [Plenodomus tracheiphilus IPT5]
MLSKVRKISKLNQTIHRLSIRSVLAEHENAAEEYYGGAFFWSPRKVKEALDRQLQQGLEEEQLQHQKAEAARVREEQRQEKLRAVEARRAARTAARLMRQEEKAREAADRALRQAARRTQQRLQQAQKIAQRGKRRRLKVATKAGSKKRAAAQPQGGGEASGAAAGPPPSQSRHGRSIKLPAKYR